MGSMKVRTQLVQGQFTRGPVLCMDIDGAAAPTGSNTRFDVFNRPKGFITFDVGDFPLAVHPALLLAPAQEIGLTRPIVDLLCRFARTLDNPLFATRDVHRFYPDWRMRWPDPLPPSQEHPVFIYSN